jgi:hypothetical protein
MKPIKNIIYHCGKVCEGVVKHCEQYVPKSLGLINVEFIDEQLDRLMEELTAHPSRFADLPERLKVHYEPIKFALAYLRRFFCNPMTTIEERYTADIVAGWLYIHAPRFVDDYQPKGS